ncbi:MAG: hypothetical protein NZP72_02950, partial [Geminicoccaceae bacterium]|nr:hypothetical protein [Geminicoccaceae bacterium]
MPCRRPSGRLVTIVYVFYGVVSVPATPSVSPALWQPEQLVDLCDTVFRAETLRLAESVVPAVVTFTLS